MIIKSNIKINTLSNSLISSELITSNIVTAKRFRSLVTMNSLIYCFIYFVIFDKIIVSVNAIRCYQCNSHYNGSCLGVLPNEHLFLEDCPSVDEDSMQPFCRKIALTIEYKEDHRVIRSCGYTPYINRSERCLTADSEGYLEQVCQCFTDGCNAATSNLRKFNLYENFIFIISILLIGLITRVNHLIYI